MMESGTYGIAIQDKKEEREFAKREIKIKAEEDGNELIGGFTETRTDRIGIDGLPIIELSILYKD